MYYAYIDGLRAIAVIAVVVFHLDENWLPGGFAGVDIFFVISGFVVSLAVSKKNINTGFVGFVIEFYARRVRRILPALIFCLVSTFIFSALLIPESWLSGGSRKAGLFAFFGLSNFALADSGEDYFSPALEFNPFTHTWSLGVEEQFYLVFPFLIAPWILQYAKRMLFVFCFCIVVVCSLIYCMFNLGDGKIYFLPWGRLWELGSGVFLYQLIRFVNDKGYVIDRAMLRFGVAAGFVLLLVAVLFSDKNEFPFPGALFAVAGAFVLILFISLGGEGRNFLEGKFIVFVGKLSYSLYLWHWPVFTIFRWTLGLDGLSNKFAAVAVSFVFSIISYFYIENLFRSSYREYRLSSFAVIVAAIPILLCFALFSRYISLSQSIIGLSQVSMNSRLWYPKADVASADRALCSSDISQKSFKAGVYFEYSPGACGEKNDSGKRLYVMGDSHALAYERMLTDFANRLGLEIEVYSRPGCAFFPMYSSGKPDDGCKAYYVAALHEISSKAQRGDILFLPSLRLPRLSEQTGYYGSDAAYQTMFSDASKEQRAHQVNITEFLLRPLVDADVKIVLEAPKPIFKVAPFRCSDFFNKNNSFCEPGMSVSRAFLESLRLPVLDSYGKLSERFPTGVVSVWDPFERLCPAKDECFPFTEGNPLFFDGDHLSGYGNDFLYDHFASFMRKLL